MATIVQVDALNIKGEQEYDDWDLAVSGVKVSVPAYTFVAGGASRVLDEPWDFSIVDRSEEAQVMAYLVEEVATGNIEVLIDEVLVDGSDAPYRFKDGAYNALAQLWYCKVPPNTTSLDELEIMAFRTVDVSPPDEEA